MTRWQRRIAWCAVRLFIWAHAEGPRKDFLKFWYLGITPEEKKHG